LCNFFKGIKYLKLGVVFGVGVGVIGNHNTQIFDTGCMA